MKKIQATYQQERLTKWLLVLALFFNPYTFSGAVGNLPSGKSPTQIELLISNKTTARRQTVCYKTAPKLFPSAFYENTHRNRLNDLFTYHTLIKVKLDHSSRLFHIQDPADLLRLSKKIPQDLDEEIHLTSLG